MEKTVFSSNSAGTIRQIVELKKKKRKYTELICLTTLKQN